MRSLAKGSISEASPLPIPAQPYHAPLWDAEADHPFQDGVHILRLP